MALMTSYLIKTGNAGEFFSAIRNAKAPERFTTSFLKDLDFSSSNDRLWIGVLLTAAPAMRRLVCTCV